MTAQILSSELSNLIQEAKRKVPELRNAAEKSLQELKSLPTTSEAQLNADLSRRSQFIEPFLIACSPKASKHAGTGISCLQRLAIAGGLPKTRLKDVLEVARECSGLGALDVQLKVLQILPAILQNYPDELRGALLFTLLQTCSILQSSKTASISSTAAATLQQLVSAIFESIAAEDGKALEFPTVAEVPGDDGPIPVRAVAHDGCRVFRDICLLIEGSKTQNVRFAIMPETTSLELVETILVSHANLISGHPELSHTVRTTLLPYLIKTFAEKRPFPVVLRTTRLMYLIIRNHIDLFPGECESILEYFNQVLDSSEAALNWKRVLCMEVLRGIFSEPRILLSIYSRFDEAKSGKPIVRTCLAGFVRLASEKPSLIGLGQQSTIPVGNYFQRESGGEASSEAGFAASKAEGTAGVSTLAVPGISNQWSSVRAPCIDQLDKSEPPTLPETYIYSLVLLCLNNLAESLATFILPLTVHHSRKTKKKRQTTQDDAAQPSANDDSISNSPPPESNLKRSQSYKKRTIPANPLQLENHPASSDVHTIAALVDQCWPAVLASCSTFFYAALDSDHYRALVRSYQKFAQVAGLLRMSTPRDAFLTTLGKAAVPPHVLAATFSSPTNQGARSPSILDSAKELLSVDNLVNQASTLLPERGGRRASLDSGESSLSSRNLLCLRALLNLAIALGPTLVSAWSIIFETLQQADQVLSSHSRLMSRGGPSVGQPGSEQNQIQILASEVNAVSAATSRLFESTSDFPNESFIHVLSSLCGFLDIKPSSTNMLKSSPPVAPISSHKRISSFSGISIKTDTTDKDFVFALAKLRELISGNVERFINNSPADSGWAMLTSTAVSLASNSEHPATARLLAVELISRLSRDSITFAIEEKSALLNEVQCRSLSALLMICKALGRSAGSDVQLATDETSDEVHSIVLETMRAILEQIGDSLDEGWAAVFQVVLSVFVPLATSTSSDDGRSSTKRLQLYSVSLGRSSFASVQLICSDFLSNVPDSSLLTLVDTIFWFCSQSQDLNISLTTTTLFWNLSDLLYGRTTEEALNGLANDISAEIDPDNISSNEIVNRLLEFAEINSMPALWLLLLRRLIDIAADRREEVRTSALHTILRIFDNHGEDLSPEAWELCLRTIILPMIRQDAGKYSSLLEQSSDSHKVDAAVSELKGRVTTTRLLLDGLSKLFSTYLLQIVQCSRFAQIWIAMFDTFSSYLDCRIHDINSSVYSTISRILSTVDKPDILSKEAIQRSASLWTTRIPESGTAIATHNNQEAFESYVKFFRAVYGLSKDAVTTMVVQKITENLEQIIIQSDAPTYSSDADSMTALQSAVIECLSALSTDTLELERLGSDLQGASSVIVGLLARFIGLPFQPREAGSGLTFVALSKAAMDLLHVECEEVLRSSLLLALNNMEKSIASKYGFKIPGKTPPLWQKATTTFIRILSVALPRISTKGLDEETFRAYWEVIVRAASGITRANIEEAADSIPIFDDEDFDIKSLTELNALIVPALGSGKIPDATRRTYTRALFESSLIHALEPGELPDLTTSPLQDVYNIRFGRTYNPEPTLRGAMAYHCLGDLLSLVSKTTTTPEKIALARAASPYLILRAALPLKAYIADQPLRGRVMPQPDSERQELLFLLRGMTSLESEKEAIPEADGLRSEGRRHLVRLYGLVVQALGVAGGAKDVDMELVAQLKVWLDCVGEEFQI